MSEPLGIAKKRLIKTIVEDTWKIDPNQKKFNLLELMYVVQELEDDEGKKYFEDKSMNRGHHIFRNFAKQLLYRNAANYDSMVLLTADKGCLTDDTLIEMPRDLIKYPNGIPIKDLINKGSIYVYSFNNKTKKLELKKSDGVEFVKNDDVYELETINGMKIKATGDHPFMLIDGTYKQLNKIVYKNTQGKVSPKYMKNGKLIYTDRLRIFSRPNIMNYNNFIKIDYDKIEREKNNINLNYIKNGCRIKSIKYLGKQNVYDVVNVRDNHNFIANGFVVSNTGKSSAAIMLARAWCKLLGIKFNPDRHIAYNNADMMNKIDNLNKFEPIIADEAVRFATSTDWAKAEHKELKKKLAQVRTKHLLYILCFPLKIGKVEKTYLESFVTYWIDLYGRGLGAVFVKDKNPVNDAWRMNDFKKIGSYTEFTSPSEIEKRLKNHPNYWTTIKFPKPPKWLYDKYLIVREKNIYDEDAIMGTVAKEDIWRALLILALRDLMKNDETLSMNRIILHLRNEYDIHITKKMVENIVLDSSQLIDKVRHENLIQ